jgi:hypothetical protein
MGGKIKNSKFYVQILDKNNLYNKGKCNYAIIL